MSKLKFLEKSGLNVGGKHRYDAVYRCMLCGKYMVLGNPVELEYNQLPEVCGAIVKNQIFAGNPYLHQAPMQIPCKCADGNCGMAYFAGMMRV